MNNIKKIKILDVFINDINMQDTIEKISLWCKGKIPHHIITADAYMIDTASYDQKLKDIINNASLVTPDSSGVLLASRLCGTPIADKVSGCEIAENLCKISGKENIKIFFLGAKQKIISQAITKMQQKYPDINIVGSQHGYFLENETDKICESIKESQADILFVAMGIPKQEFWINDNILKTGVKVAIGIGGTFDVMSGIVNRAPIIYQKLYLEWLYRYFQDPSKSYKVKKLPAFFLKVILNRIKNGKR